MSLPTIGTSAGSQLIRTSMLATSDANGNATFSLNGPPQGQVLTFSCTLANAPSSAVFTAEIGIVGAGSIVDTWGGDSTAGRFQLLPAEVLTVTATGLAPTTAYSISVIGFSDDGPVQLVTPEPNISALLASFPQAGVDVLSSGSQTLTAPGGTTITFATFRAYQTIVVTTDNVATAWSLTAAVHDATIGGAASAFLASPTLTRGNQGAGHITMALPIVCIPGDTLSLKLIPSATKTLNVVVYGITAAIAVAYYNGLIPIMPPGCLIRQDGRPFPLGSNAAHGTNTAGGTLIGAVAGQSIILVTLAMEIQANGANANAGDVACTIGGTSFNPCWVQCGPSLFGVVQANIPPGGLLLDVDTAVTYGFAAAPAACSVDATYDLTG